MKKSAALLAAFLSGNLLAGGVGAQHEHHGMAHHKIASGAKLTVKNDAAARTLTVRIGPLDLPAHADHHCVAQASDLFLSIPIDGWIIAYHPRLVDEAGKPLPNKLLHHVAFWNTERPDFLCPNKPEHIFGAGGEMNDWPALPGFGYRVRKGDRIRISTMFHNPTDSSFPTAYLEVKVDYRSVANQPQLKNVYPVWFDVEQCAPSGYDLKPGKNVNRGEFRMAYSGTLLGVGGHLHDYGQRLILENDTRKEEVAALSSTLDSQGHLLSMPVISFAHRGGYRLEKGETFKVTATYNNPTGKSIPEGAMGIVVEYFLPENDHLLTELKKTRIGEAPLR